MQEDDPLALGLLKNFHSTGKLIIVLPLMSNLSKLFQTSALSYSHKQPSIQSTKSRIIAQDNLLDDLIMDMAVAGGRFDKQRSWLQNQIRHF